MSGRPKTRAQTSKPKPADPFKDAGGYATVTTLPVEQATAIMDRAAGIVPAQTDGRVIYPFDAEKFEQMLEQLADGKTIKNVTALVGIGGSTHRAWMRQRPDLEARWYAARASGAHSYADKVIEVADKIAGGDLDPQAGRVISEAYRWMAGKLSPMYSDRLNIDATVHAAGPDLSNWPTECLLEVEAVLNRYGLALDGTRTTPDPQSIPGEVILGALQPRD